MIICPELAGQINTRTRGTSINRRLGGVESVKLLLSSLGMEQQILDELIGIREDLKKLDAQYVLINPHLSTYINESPPAEYGIIKLDVKTEIRLTLNILFGSCEVLLSHPF